MRPAGGTLRPGIDEVVRRARSGESAAVSALVETGEYIGMGLALVVNAFNPGRVYVGGEITAVWELLEGPIRDALAASTITDRARDAGRAGQRAGRVPTARRCCAGHGSGIRSARRRLIGAKRSAEGASH